MRVAQFWRNTFAAHLNGRGHRELAGAWYLICLGLGMVVILTETFFRRYGLFKSPTERVGALLAASAFPYIIGTVHWFQWKAATRRGDSGEFTAIEIRRRRPMALLLGIAVVSAIGLEFFLSRS